MPECLNAAPAQYKLKYATMAMAAAAEEEVEDLITIVDVPDPNDPEYEEVKTRRRPLTAAQLSNLRPMLQKVGAYSFFSKEFNFADGPAVKEFIHSVEIEGFKPTKAHKLVQEKFTAKVAGREVVIDAELIEKAFGLVDDGENIVKPRGDDVNGLHSFYIKPHHVEQCQTPRGVNLTHLRGEYSYFKNLAHQIQAYICGVPEDGFIKFTQYRALDMMVRGKPVNWNRYILQNFQERIRKYQRSPCALYFGGTLTALIYQALDVDYQLVNKLPHSPPTAVPAIQDVEEPASDSGKKRTASGSVTPKRTPGSRSRALATKATSAPATRSSARVSKRKQNSEERSQSTGAKRHKNASGSGKRRRQEVDSEPSVLENEDTETEEDEDMMIEEDDSEEELASSGLSRRNALLKKLDGAADIPEVLTGHKTYRLSTLYNQAIGTPITRKPPKLTDSKDLWSKYAQYYALGQECHLEHIISKKALEDSQRRFEDMERDLEAKDKLLMERLQQVDELESAIKLKDAKLLELRAQVLALRDKSQGAPSALEEEHEHRSDEAAAGHSADGGEMDAAAMSEPHYELNQLHAENLDPVVEMEVEAGAAHKEIDATNEEEAGVHPKEPAGAEGVTNQEEAEQTHETVTSESEREAAVNQHKEASFHTEEQIEEVGKRMEMEVTNNELVIYASEARDRGTGGVQVAANNREAGEETTESGGGGKVDEATEMQQQQQQVEMQQQQQQQQQKVLLESDKQKEFLEKLKSLKVGRHQRRSSF